MILLHHRLIYHLVAGGFFLSIPTETAISFFFAQINHYFVYFPIFL